MRIVLDTNILISSLISKGTPPFELYVAWQAGKFVLVTSEAQLQEIKRVFGYQHLRKYIRPDEATALVERIRKVAAVLSSIEPVRISKDSADDAIIATAITGKAHYLVTGDKRDLLSLKMVGGIPIVTAREALEKIGRAFP